MILFILTMYWIRLIFGVIPNLQHCEEFEYFESSKYRLENELYNAILEGFLVMHMIPIFSL